jgi:hypothetical protein
MNDGLDARSQIAPNELRSLHFIDDVVGAGDDVVVSNLTGQHHRDSPGVQVQTMEATTLAVSRLDQEGSAVSFPTRAADPAKLRIGELPLLAVRWREDDQAPALIAASEECEPASVGRPIA